MLFESHITVENINPSEFKIICQRLGVKAVIIEQDTGSSVPIQMMTAKFHKTTYEVALVEMHELATNFSYVVRRKLEEITKTPVNYKYLEFHSKFEVEEPDLFTDMVLNAGAHTSVNSLKSDKFRFVTTRDEGTLDQVVSGLKRLGFKHLGTIREAVMYDDNPSLDSNWTNCLECPLKRG